LIFADATILPVVDICTRLKILSRLKRVFNVIKKKHKQKRFIVQIPKKIKGLKGITQCTLLGKIGTIIDTSSGRRL